MPPPRLPPPSLRQLLTPLTRTLPHHRPLTLPSHRTYHSHEHPSPPPFPPTQTTILATSLTQVPTHGFTSKSLTLGALAAGYPAASTNLFARGPFDLIHYHLVTARLSLRDRLRRRFVPTPAGDDDDDGDNPAWRAMDVRARVQALAVERLRVNAERGVVGRWQEALALMALPRNVPPSVRELALLADEFCFLAGDTAVDSSWYTRRAALAAVYASAELFMTQDASQGFVETEAFLERRLRDVNAVGMGVGAMGQWVGFTGMGVVNALRSKGVRI